MGGFSEAWRTQWLDRYALNSIWDDRVLRRAFELDGGVPRVQLIAADDSLPAPLEETLRTRLLLPA